MTNSADLSLPRNLDDGLVMRWATVDDAGELAEFNFEYHSDNPSGVPDYWLRGWTKELLSGEHPATSPNDITVVVDMNAGGRIVSTAVLISQTWSYEDCPFGCGRIELIATANDYRRRGLVRLQMDALHARSLAKGELIQAITGIPWFYRQFGYEMAIDLGGSRLLPNTKIEAIPEGLAEKYLIRPVDFDDIPTLSKLYDRHCSSSLIRCLRDESMWRFEIATAPNDNTQMRRRYVIETSEGNAVGYFELLDRASVLRIRELAVWEDQPLREICKVVARKVKLARDSRKEEIGKPPNGLTFSLGREHPVYEALDPELDKLQQPYAWYVRVNDLRAWLLHIRPVLESRLRGSAMAGFDGELRLNFYTSQLKMDFKQGKISSVDAYVPDHFWDGHAYFPDLTFLQLLFGCRSMDELKHAFPDCFTDNTRGNDPAVLMSILFPKRPSHISMIS